MVIFAAKATATIGGLAMSEPREESSAMNDESCWEIVRRSIPKEIAAEVDEQAPSSMAKRVDIASGLLERDAWPLWRDALSSWARQQTNSSKVLRAMMSIDLRIGVWCACQVARTALPILPKGEDRPRLAVETAERWVYGRASETDCNNATAFCVAAFDACKSENNGSAPACAAANAASSAAASAAAANACKRLAVCINAMEMSGAEDPVTFAFEAPDIIANDHVELAREAAAYAAYHAASTRVSASLSGSDEDASRRRRELESQALCEIVAEAIVVMPWTTGRG